MPQTSKYCGFVCSNIIERQQKILDEIDEFAKFNPEYAQVMRDKIINLTKKEVDNNNK